MKVLIGIDDTDNLESRGTGFMARQLADHLRKKGLMKPFTVVRHQLFVSPEIPFTSHNSSASISGELSGNIDVLKQELEAFVLHHSASGSDAGICLLSVGTDSDYSDIIQWGRDAKCRVLTVNDAHILAEKSGVFLKGLTGEKIGVIGSLAAVGLRLSGNDGRLLWMKHLRETTGVYKAGEIQSLIGIECIKTTDGNIVDTDRRISIGEWTRPVLQKNLITLYVESVNSEDYEYQSAPKQFIKDISE